MDTTTRLEHIETICKDVVADVENMLKTNDATIAEAVEFVNDVCVKMQLSLLGSLVFRINDVERVSKQAFSDFIRESVDAICAHTKESRKLFVDHFYPLLADK